MKKIAILLSIILLLIIGLTTENKTPTKIEDYIKEKPKEEKIIKELKEKYNNNDIIGFLEIPNVLAVPVVQNNNNEYYLNHNIKKEEDPKGAIFMDYRNTINDKKQIIYGHNSTRRKIIFTNLINYENESFYKKHPEFYIYTENGKKTYKIFSSYVENKDFDYINLHDFSGLSYDEHLQKLKNKSFYDTKQKVDKNSKIVILQTCNFNIKYKENKNYQLVIGVEQNK